MKNKGFTLVELLAVITVLGIIGLIAIPTVTSIINSSKEKAKKIQIEEIIRSAKSWAANNTTQLSETDTYHLSVQTLIDEGYIATDDIKDPTNSNKTLNQCISITYSTKYNNYLFNYVNCAVTGTE